MFEKQVQNKAYDVTGLKEVESAVMDFVNTIHGKAAKSGRGCKIRHPDFSDADIPAV